MHRIAGVPSERVCHRAEARRAQWHSRASCSACPTGSSWNVQCSTSKWSPRQPWSSCSIFSWPIALEHVRSAPPRAPTAPACPEVIVQACRSWSPRRRPGQDVRAHLRHVDVLGRRLQQDVQRLAQQLPGARDDHQADQQRGDRVGGLPAGGQDDRGRDQHGERAQRVRRHLQEGAAHVEALLLAAHQQRRARSCSRPGRSGRRRWSARPRCRRVRGTAGSPRTAYSRRRRAAAGSWRARPGSRRGRSRRCAARSAGRLAKWIASSAMPRPSASVAMWAASATRASESASRPPTISTTITVSVMPSAIRSRPRYAAAAVPAAGRVRVPVIVPCPHGSASFRSVPADRGK